MQIIRENQCIIKILYFSWIKKNKASMYLNNYKSKNFSCPETKLMGVKIVLSVIYILYY